LDVTFSGLVNQSPMDVGQRRRHPTACGSNSGPAANQDAGEDEGEGEGEDEDEDVMNWLDRDAGNSVLSLSD
jgi:hypothetical protein